MATGATGIGPAGWRTPLASWSRTPLDEGPDEAGSPRRPRRRSRGPGIGFGQRGEQVERLDGADLDGHEVHRLGIVEVTPGGGLGQEEVQPHERLEEVHVVVGEAEPGADGGGQHDAGVGVVTGIALADVVDERADEQQVGPSHRRRQRRRLHDGFDEVAVDGEAVEGVALRAVLDRGRLRHQLGPQAAVVERLEHGNEPWARRQEREEVVADLGRPGFGQRRRPGRHPAHGAARERQAHAGRFGGGVEQRHHVDSVVRSGEGDLVIDADHARTEVARPGTAQRPSRPVDPGADAVARRRRWPSRCDARRRRPPP